MLGADLQHRYGEKIYKLTLHGGFDCPNRDGTLGRGGCTFCNVASFSDEQMQYKTIAQQLSQQSKKANRANRYLAYFQAYTSTYAEVCLLQDIYKQALTQADIIGICVGTRPDCVPDSVLDLLAQYGHQGYEVWLELGLQSANDRTLKKIHRGHDFACYCRTLHAARLRGIKVCTHLIIGLPNETLEANLNTLNKVIENGVDGLKLHPLHIVDGSIMAKAWRAGRVAELTFSDYVHRACELIRHTPVDVIYHRVSATAKRPVLLAPAWCENHWLAMNEIDKNLICFGGQGSALGQRFIPKARR